jgi:hypothetical protein
MEMVSIPVIEERIKRIEKATEKALRLQAKEYERRLEILNHEAIQLRDMQAKYVPREVFDSKHYELEQKIQINTDYILAQRGKSDLQKWIPWLLAAATLAYAIFKK